jgi:acetolactate synthase-1/3 small subunit
MTNTLLIQIDRAEGSLQRLIGLIERRGFHIDRLSLSDIGAHREVRVSVRGRDAGRCIDVLGRQIDRLIGVSRIAAISTPAPMEREVAPCPA